MRLARATGDRPVRVVCCVLRDPSRPPREALGCNKSVTAQDHPAAPVLANAPPRARLYPHTRRKIASVPVNHSNSVAHVRGARCVLWIGLAPRGQSPGLGTGFVHPICSDGGCEAPSLATIGRHGEAQGHHHSAHDCDVTANVDDAGAPASRQHRFGRHSPTPAVGTRGGSGARDRSQLALRPPRPTRAHQRFHRAPTPTPGACPRGVCRPPHRTFPVLRSRRSGRRPPPPSDRGSRPQRG